MQITVYLGLTGVLESRKFITYYQLFRPQLSLSPIASNEVFLLIATSIEAILIGLPGMSYISVNKPITMIKKALLEPRILSIIARCLFLRSWYISRPHAPFF